MLLKAVSGRQEKRFPEERFVEDNWRRLKLQVRHTHKLMLREVPEDERLNVS